VRAKRPQDTPTEAGGHASGVHSHGGPTAPFATSSNYLVNSGTLELGPGRLGELLHVGHAQILMELQCGTALSEGRLQCHRHANRETSSAVMDSWLRWALPDNRRQRAVRACCGTGLGECRHTALSDKPASLGARVLPKSCNSDVWLSDKRRPQTSRELAILRKVRCMTALA
jgi:hypothetical protein